MATAPILPCFLLMSWLLMVGNSHGLTLKLIHRDSPESPYYEPNMTREEKLHRLFLQTRAREGFHSGKFDMNPETIRGRIHTEDQFLYMVKPGIGTFPNHVPLHKPYFLQIDTGSSTTWTQCEDCHHTGGECFEQSVPPFPRRLSRTYRALLIGDRPRHPLCNPDSRRNQYCAYHARYGDNSSTTGILGADNFSFESNGGRTEGVRIVFGCGVENINFDVGANNVMTGILGLGWGPHSLVNQAMDQTRGLFSYCLSPLGSHVNTLLRFGNDIARRQGLETTPLLHYPPLEPYFVGLQGLSINGQRLPIPPRVFQRRNGVGGTIIDSGASVTNLVPDAYRPLRQTLMRIFSMIPGFQPVHDPYLDLCYRMPRSFGFESLPTITFHFDGDDADLHVEPQHGFALGAENPESFCLAMLPSHINKSMIGAYQQINHRFVFDTRSRQLHFGPEDCSHDVRV